MIKAAGPLVEREIEIGRLLEAIDRSRAGSGGVVSIQGGAGIGKTVLLDVAVGLAEERGMAVFAAVASELEQAFPFVVARQLLGKGSSELR